MCFAKATPSLSHASSRRVVSFHVFSSNAFHCLIVDHVACHFEFTATRLSSTWFTSIWVTTRVKVVRVVLFEYTDCSSEVLSLRTLCGKDHGSDRSWEPEIRECTTYRCSSHLQPLTPSKEDRGSFFSTFFNESTDKMQCPDPVSWWVLSSSRKSTPTSSLILVVVRAITLVFLRTLLHQKKKEKRKRRR